MNVESALARLESGEALNTAETMALGQSPDAVTALAQALRKGSDPVRERGIGLMVDLGRVKVAPKGRVQERPGPIIDSPAVVDFLVAALNDASAEVRRKAAVALAGLVPSDLLRTHASAVITSFERHPQTDGALVLLGKTETREALAFIDSHPEVRQSSAEDVEMVRARLGNHQAEDAVIVAYVSAATAKVKAQQARRLGYIATDRAVRLLARDMRTPETYAWIDAAKRSMRVHVIEGLHLAYLREPVFWKPFLPPQDDSYYQEIEDWLTAKLDVRWDNPRPPFLYQQSAPMAMPPQQP